MVTLIASRAGAKVIQAVREKSSRTVNSPRWLEEASQFLKPDWKPSEYYVPGVNEGSWRRFLYRQRPINAEVFKAYCHVLGLSWEEIAEAQETEETQTEETRSEVSEFKITAENLRGYCQKIVEKYESKWSGSLYIPEKGVIKEDIPIYASIYSDYTNHSEKVNLLEALQEKQRTILLGEPGSGKTTSLEKLCLEYARQFYQNPNNNQTVPIIIRLSGYMGDLFQIIRSSLTSTGSIKLRIDSSNTIDQFLQKEKLLLLFDGLNEIGKKWRDSIISQLLQFMNLYPTHRYIISSRPQDDLWRMIPAREIVPNLVIQPIDYEDAIQYLTLHLGEKVGRLAYGEVVNRVRSLLRLPLVLWMFKEEILRTKISLENKNIEITKSRIREFKIVPQNRGEMYKRFMNRFLISERTKIFTNQTTRESIKEIVLSNLALEMQVQKTLSFPLQEAIQNISSSLSIFQGEILPLSILNEIQQSGLLVGDDYLSFSHQTFQEFFSAIALCKSSSIKTINQYINDSWWSETFIFLSGILGVDNLEKFNMILRLIADVDPFLAAKCFLEGKSSTEGRSILQKRLSPMLESQNWFDRKNAAEILGLIGDSSIVSPLSKLLDDSSGDVRWQAATSLINIPGKEAESALIKALQDPGWATRARAAEALGHMKATRAIPYLRPLLISTMPRERGDAVWALFLMEINRELSEVVDLLQDKDDRISSSVDLILQASATSNPISTFSRAVESEKYYIRSSAVYMLTRLISVHSIPLIRKCLEDSHPDVTIIAMQSLAELNAVEYIHDVLQVLDHPVGFARAIAAHCCSLFGSNTAIPFLLPLLRDSDDEVRFVTVRTLGNLSAEYVVPDIIPLLKDSSEKVRIQAVIALGALGDTSSDVIEYLEPILNDKSSEVREATIKSIELIKKRQRITGFFRE